MGSVRKKSQFVLEALEPRVLLSANPPAAVGAVSAAAAASCAVDEKVVTESAQTGLVAGAATQMGEIFTGAAQENLTADPVEAKVSAEREGNSESESASEKSEAASTPASERNYSGARLNGVPVAGQSGMDRAGEFLVKPGAVLSGSGVIAAPVVVAGSISPGNSPGHLDTLSQTWSGGGDYVWEINNVTGNEGANPGWDFLNITGGLLINATPTNRFTIHITSLTTGSSPAPGPVALFDSTTSYSWRLLATTSAITGFNPNSFNLDTAQFSNSLGTGFFAITLGPGGKELRLLFSPTAIVSVTAPAWVSEGPAPILVPGGTDLFPSLDQSLGAGAISSIAVDSTNPGRVYVGAVNGGIWRTDNISRQITVDGNVHFDPSAPSAPNVYTSTVPSAFQTTAVAGAAGSTLTAGRYQYRFTYVNVNESNASDPVTINLGAGATQIDLSGIPANGFQARNVYRTKAGGGTFFLVATLNAVSTTYSDTLPDSALGAPGHQMRAATITFPLWEQLNTDQLPSLSITALAISPLDSAGRKLGDPLFKADTLYAGTGALSNGRPRGTAVGVYKTTHADGPANAVIWSVRGGQIPLSGLSITAIVPTIQGASSVNNQVVLIAAEWAGDAKTPGGVFRSTDAGVTVSRVPMSTEVNAFKNLSASDLMADPRTAGSFYAAVLPGISTSTATPPVNTLYSRGGVFASVDWGATWQSIPSALDTASNDVAGGTTIVNIRLATHKTNSTYAVYAGLVRGPPVKPAALARGTQAQGAISSVFRSADGVAWTPLGNAAVEAPIHQGLQGVTNFSMAADPIDPNVIYIGGDRSPNLYRASGSTWSQLQAKGNTAPHTDSRAMAFLDSRTLLEADDGGLFQLSDALNDPSFPAGPWIPLNGDISISEVYSVAYDHVSNVILAGTQDNGSIEQVGLRDGVNNDGDSDGSGNPLTDESDERLFWRQVLGGDGNTQAVAYLSNGDSVRYSLGNNLQNSLQLPVFIRREFNPSGAQVGPTPLLQLARPSNSAMLLGLNPADRAFPGGALIPYVVDASNPNGLVLGLSQLYWSGSQGDALVNLSQQIQPFPDFPTNLLTGQNRFDAIATANNSGATAVYASRGKFILVSPGAPSQKFTSTYLFTSDDPNDHIRDIVVDPANWQRAWVVSRSAIWATVNGGKKWSHINATGLPADLFSVELVQNSLLIGASDGVYRASLTGPDASSKLRFSRYGLGIPRVAVTDLHYYSDATQSVLVAATFGRGVWRDDPEPGTMTINGSPGPDEIKLERDPDEPYLLDVFIKNPVSHLFELHQSIELDSISDIIVAGGGGDDSLIIDNSDGLVRITGTFQFDGGTGTDTLSILASPPVQILSPGGGKIEYRTGGGRQTIQTEHVEQVPAATNPLISTGAILASLRGGISEASLWSGLFDDPEFLPNLPVLGDTLLSALARGFGAGDKNILRALIESGENAFPIDSIGESTISTLADLRLALDNLDAVAGNVSLSVNSITGAPLFDVTVLKTLSGSAEINLSAAGGNLNILGSGTVAASVQLHVAFGVDANGFYIVERNADPELAISNVQFSGDLEGAGNFGFLEVTLASATLALDPNVQLDFFLHDPGTESADGLIRLGELGTIDSHLVTAQLLGNPNSGPDDMAVTADFTVSALLHGQDAEPFTLGAASVAFLWNDINDLAEVRVKAMTTGGQRLLDFLNFDPVEALASLKKLSDSLSQFRDSPLLDVKIPFASGRTLGDVFDFSKAWVDKLYSQFAEFDLIAQNPVPLVSDSGKITADAKFSLQIGDETPVNVTIAQSATVTNTNLQDLVDDFNAAFESLPGLALRVEAFIADGKLTITLLPGNGDHLKLVAESSSDPIVTQLGFVQQEVAISKPLFGSLQEFLDLMSSNLDPDGPGPLTFNLHLNYDQASRSLMFHVQFGATVTQSASFAYDTTIGLGDWADLSYSGGLGLTASINLDFKLGLDFSAAETPKLLGSFVLPPPSSGRLTGDSSFNIKLNDGTLYPISVLASETSSFTQLSDLVRLLNSKLSPYNFDPGTGPFPLNQAIRFIQARKADGSIATGIRLEAINEDLDADGHLDPVNEDTNGNGQLDPGEDLDGDRHLDVNENLVYQNVDATLAANNALDSMLNKVHSITIEGAVSDPVFTEIGFNQSDVARSKIKGLFMQDVSLSGAGTISSSNLAVSARLGIFIISSSGSTATGTFTGALTLVNPAAGGSPRIYLGPLLGDLAHIRDYVGINPTLTASLDIDLQNLTLAPNLPGLLPADPAQRVARIFIPDIHDLHINPEVYNITDTSTTNNTGIFITFPKFGALGQFNCLSWTDIVIAIGSLSHELSQFKSFDFLNKPLPLVNKSISQIIDFAGDFAATFNGLATGNGKTLDQLETQIQDLLHIPDNSLEFSVEHQEVALAAGTLSTKASARFNPSGSNNALLITAAANGDTLSEVKFVDDGSLPAAADVALVNYDAISKVLTVHYNATYTRAITVCTYITDHLPALFTCVPDTATGTGTDGSSNDGTGTVHQTALRMLLKYHVAYADSLPFNFNLGDLVNLLPADSAIRPLLAGVASFLTIQGSGNLNVTASANVQLELGLDVSNPCGWKAFFYDDGYNGPNTGTNITLAASIHGTNLNFTAGIGALTISVKNGTATLDSDGLANSVGGDQDATFSVGLKDFNRDGRHYIRSSETFFDSNNIDITFTAGASAVLPLYTLGGSIPLGPSTDLGGDGYADNDLVVIIPSLKQLFFPKRTDALGMATLTFPGVNNDLVFTYIGSGTKDGRAVKMINTAGGQSASSPDGTSLEVRIKSLVKNADQVIGDTALTAQLTTLGWSVARSAAGAENGSPAGKAYADLTILTPDIASLFSSFNACDMIHNAPMLLDGLDALLGTIQAGLATHVLNRNLPLVGSKLNQAADFISEFRTGLLAKIRAKLAEAGDPIGLLQEAIFNALGPPSGLDLLVRVDEDGKLLDASGALVDQTLPESQQMALAGRVTDFHQIQIKCTGDKLDFKVRLAKSIPLVNTKDHPINFDIGIPGLGLEVDGNVNVALDIDLKLYFGISASDRFYFDTSSTQELYLGFSITIPGMHARGSLFFLQLDAADDRADPSSFTGAFTVDIRGPTSHPDKLTFADFRSGFDFGDAFHAQLIAKALVNLDLAISFGGNVQFPRLLAQFNLDWEWSLGGDPNGALTFGFHDVQLDAGQFISQFIKPILDQVRKVTGPAQPLVDILTTPIPILSDLAGQPIDMLYLAKAFGYLKPGTEKFVRDLAVIITLVNNVSFTDNGSILIPLGSFNLQTNALGAVERKDGDPDPAAQDLSNGTSDTGIKSFFKNLEELGFKFPFLKISELFKLFTGQPVTIVEYHMPVLDFQFRFEKSIALYPPLYLVFGGEIGAHIDLTFGYDTYGLQKFFSSSDKHPTDVFDGFFVKDLNDQGEDVPEIVLSGGLFAGLELNGGIAEAGVTGGVFAELDFNLNDPDNDGKVRLSELIANAKHDVRCIFDLHGALYVELTAFLKIHLLVADLDFEWDFARITLLTFDLVCPQPVLADVNTSGLLTLHMGPRAGDRVNGDSTDGDENFAVKHISGAGTPADPETVEVSFNGTKQTYKGVTAIAADGGQGNDSIDLRGVQALATVHGGDGNDTIYLGGAAGSSAYGDAGNDTMTAGFAASATAVTLHGGDGNDTLTAGNAGIIIYGDGGNDTITGSPMADFLYGGLGNDTITGGDGNDTITGGEGADHLDGGAGNDWIDGGAGDDRITGDHGDDQLIGGAGDDFIDGGPGNDVVLGDFGTILSPVRFADIAFPATITNISGTGNNVLAGGPGADIIFGAGGDDKIFGGTLLASGQNHVAGSDPNEFTDGSDFIDGGDGNDTIFADDGHAGQARSFPGATIGGFAWFDISDPLGVVNNVRDSGENGLAGVSVELHKADASLVGVTSTDVDGRFTFAGLEGGEYYLVFAPQANLTFAQQNAGTDDTVDSDADTVTGRTATIHVDTGGSDTTQAAGFHGNSAQISIDNPSIIEGNSGLSNMAFTVTLSNPSSSLVTVCYKSAPGTADRILDYTSVDWTLVFQPGEIMKTILVPIVGDTIYEGVSESFTMTLGTPHNAALNPAHTVGTGTIIDDDAPPVVSVEDASSIEGTPLGFVIRLSNPSKFPVSVNYLTSQIVNGDGTLTLDAATAVLDYAGTYELTPGALTFQPGETEKPVFINTVQDHLNEYDERLNLTITIDPDAPGNFASIRRGFGTGTILDDDAAPFVHISTSATILSDATIKLEGQAGLTPVQLYISLSEPSGRPVTVNWNTSAGTARVFSSEDDPADVQYTFQTITFAPGQAKQAITVYIIGDTRVEPDEYFFVNLLESDNGQLDPHAANMNRAIIHIQNDEVPDPGPWYVQFDRSAYTVKEGDSLAVTLVAPAGSSQPVAVYWSLGGTGAGMATPGLDYIGVWEKGTSGSRQLVRFAPGETAKIFTIQTLQDNLYEGSEVFSLFLANPTGGPVRAPNKIATVTILDDDPAPHITVNDVSGKENLGPLHFEVTATGNSAVPIAVHWQAYNGSATAPGDFSPISGSFVIPAFSGVYQVNLTTDPANHIQVTLFNDATPEPIENFYVRLTLANPADAVLDKFEGIGTIEDDDPITVHGFVFMDFNGNGFFDASTEYGLSGIQVTITDSAGDHSTSTASTLTDSTGSYNYSVSVLLGDDTIKVTDSTTPAGSQTSTGSLPIHFKFTDTVVNAPNIGFTVPATEDVPADSIGSGGGSSNDTVYGGPGNDIINGGAGDDWLIGGHWLGPGGACSGNPYQATILEQTAPEGGRKYVQFDPTVLGTIGDRVFLDVNNDGRWQSGSEPGVPNIQVNLFDSAWQLIGTTWTASDGAYQFTKLAPAGYSVQFIVPSAYRFTTANVSGNSFDGTDSDADPTTGLTGLYAIGDGVTDNSIDAGLVSLPPSSSGPWSISFSQAVYNVRETDGNAMITILKTPGSFQAVGVWWTIGGTAANGLDYQGVWENGPNGGRQIVRFGADQNEQSFTISVLKDALAEAPETVLLYLSNPTGGQVKGNVSASLLLIFDNSCSDDDTIYGSEGNDLILGDYGYVDNAGTAQLLGGMGNDSLHGDDGNDQLYGQGGNDTLEGGAGNDLLNGGSDNDTYVFDGDKNLGSDTIAEAAAQSGGNDTIDLSPTSSWSVSLDLSSTLAQTVTPSLTLLLPAGNAIENAIGGSRDDILVGNVLDNRLEGGDGNDTITGSSGNDTLIGGNGSDTYLFHADGLAGHDNLIEGINAATEKDMDVIDFAGTTLSAVSLNLGLITSQQVTSTLGLSLSDAAGFENLYGGSQNDTLIGNARDNVIWGREGNDSLDGGANGSAGDTLREERGSGFVLTNTTLTVSVTGEVDLYANFENVHLTGGDTANSIDASGFSGVVHLDGRGGDDVLRGGTGVNYLTGGPGNDTIYASAGTDIITETRDADFTFTNHSLTLNLYGGGTETDTYDTTAGAVDTAYLTGGEHDNQLNASAFSGSVTLDGGAGNDVLIGTANSDTLIGGAGDDTLNGGGGNDTYVFNADQNLGADTILETPSGGTDTLDFSATETAGVNINLGDSSVQPFTGTQVINTNLTLTLPANVIENVQGSQDDDVIIGNALDNVLAGNGGNDLLTGGAGNDTLDGGTGFNPATGQPWVDRVVETRDADFTLTNLSLAVNPVSGSSESDTLISIEAATLTGGSSSNTINATLFSGPVTLNGGAGDDTLTGGSGDDVLTGGAGNDTLQGGPGNDTFLFNANSVLGTDTVTGGAGTDTLDFSETSAGLVVNLATLAPAAQTVVSGKLNLLLVDQIENAIGGAGNDSITGNHLNNILRGNGGNDTLSGLGGDDTLSGGDGNDTYVFAADNVLGTDTIIEGVGTGGTDTFDFSGTSTGITLDLGNGGDIPQTIVPGHLQLRLLTCHSIENVIGSSGNDTVSVALSANMAFFMDGGGGANDILNCNASGFAVTITANTISASGVMPVTYSGFDQIIIQP